MYIQVIDWTESYNFQRNVKQMESYWQGQ